MGCTVMGCVAKLKDPSTMGGLSVYPIVIAFGNAKCSKEKALSFAPQSLGNGSNQPRWMTSMPIFAGFTMFHIYLIKFVCVCVCLFHRFLFSFLVYLTCIAPLLFP